MPNNIAKWKREYGDIFSVTFKDKEYIFRALTFAEHDLIFSDESMLSIDVEDMIVTTAVLSPQLENTDNLPNGIITPLSQQIIDISGFDNPKYAISVLSYKRAKATEVKNLMKAFVIATIPSYTDEQLEDFTFVKLAEKVALAEQIIQIQQGVVAGAEIKLEIIDPDIEAAKAAKKQEAEKRKWDALQKRGIIPESDEKGPAIKPTIRADDPIADKLRRAMG